MIRPAPALQGKLPTRIWLLSAGTIGLVSLVLFADLPAWPRFWTVLSDAAHGPVFGLVAITFLVVLRILSRRHASQLFAMAFALAVLLGIGVEWIQGLTGRDSSWKDVATDAMGAACALSLVGWHRDSGFPSLDSESGRRAALGVALLSGALLLVPLIEVGMAYARRAAQFPVIARFDSPLDLYFGRVQYALGKREFLPDPWGRPSDAKSLRIVSSTGRWPGFALEEPTPDWRGYDRLNIDLTNPGDASIQITVRIHDMLHDQRHEDRFNQTFTLYPGRRTLIIALADVAAGPVNRELDIAHVAGVIIFASDQTVPGQKIFHLTRIWLE